MTQLRVVKRQDKLHPDSGLTEVDTAAGSSEPIVAEEGGGPQTITVWMKKEGIKDFNRFMETSD